MIGLYLYALQAILVIVGMLLSSVVYWRDKDMSRNTRFVDKAVELRQRRKGLSLAGLGLTMIGLMLFVDTYRSRHVEADGVIYLPPFVVNSVLVIGTALLLIGAVQVWVKTRQMGRIAGPITTVEPEHASV